MSGFEPGEGWRRLAKGERDQDEMIVHYGDEGSTTWIREVPVPSLPTEPYTVIRVDWRSDSARPALGDLGIRTLFPDGTWTGWAVENLLERITGFEVLAEPRAVTAKAVLDRVREALPLGADRFSQDHLTLVAREFGDTP